MPTRYVALLRGINVGGRNLIAMADLRHCLEEAGYAGVRTYIQSGNVLFDSAKAGRELESDLEALLEKRFGAAIKVLVRSRAQMQKVVSDAPAGFGTEPDQFHSDVVFLKASLTPARAVKAFQLRDGVDQVWPGTGVVYFARLSERLTQSRMSKITATPEYQLMSIRTWSTVNKLLALAKGN